MAIDPDAATVRTQLPTDKSEQGGFAGAARAHNGRYPATGHGERHPIEDTTVAPGKYNVVQKNVGTVSHARNHRKFGATV